MTRTGLFQIQKSFKMVNRGLVALGQIVEGSVKIGSFLTFEVNSKPVTLQIGGVEMADNISTRESWVGLTFVYQHEEQKKEFEQLELKEQFAEITQ